MVYIKILLIILLVTSIGNSVNGINIAGDWTDENIQIVKDAIFYTTLKIDKIEFDYLFDDITLIWGYNGTTKMCKVKWAFACTVNDEKINFFHFYMDREKSIRLVLHELGHIFSKRLRGLPCKKVPDSISLSKSEAFADMFSGWVMNDLEGTEKGEWMERNMPRFLDYVLTGRMDNTLDKNLDIMYVYY